MADDKIEFRNVPLPRGRNRESTSVRFCGSRKWVIDGRRDSSICQVRSVGCSERLPVYRYSGMLYSLRVGDERTITFH